MKKWSYYLEVLYVGFLLTANLPILALHLYVPFPSRTTEVLYILVLKYSINVWLFCGLCVASHIFLLLCPQNTNKHTGGIRTTNHFLMFAMILLSLTLLSSVFLGHLYFFSIRGLYWALCVFILLAINWIFWLWVFHGLRASTLKNSIVRCIGDRLNQGNVLRSLVMEIRGAFGGQKEDLPSDEVSFLAAATGMAVMALIYGPSIGFLLCNHEVRKAQGSGVTNKKTTDC